MTDEKPLPCPFCGESPMVVREEYCGVMSVGCINGDCLTAVTSKGKNAIARWNTRAADPRDNLPKVAGRTIRGSNRDFERSCQVHIDRLQDGLGPYDSAMMDTFAEAIRLGREYSDAMQERQPDPRDAQLREAWRHIFDYRAMLLEEGHEDSSEYGDAEDWLRANIQHKPDDIEAVWLTGEGKV